MSDAGRCDSFSFLAPFSALCSPFARVLCLFLPLIRGELAARSNRRIYNSRMMYGRIGERPEEAAHGVNDDLADGRTSDGERRNRCLHSSPDEARQLEFSRVLRPFQDSSKFHFQSHSVHR